MLGNAGNIIEVLWFDGTHVRRLKDSDSGRAFKWLLAEKDGALVLMAMPDDAGLDFHKELRDAVCEIKGWKPGELKVLGGGVRLTDGTIVHRSTAFGAMPEVYRDIVLRDLAL